MLSQVASHSDLPPLPDDLAGSGVDESANGVDAETVRKRKRILVGMLIVLISLGGAGVILYQKMAGSGQLDSATNAMLEAGAEKSAGNAQERTSSQAPNGNARQSTRIDIGTPVNHVDPFFTEQVAPTPENEEALNIKSPQQAASSNPVPGDTGGNDLSELTNVIRKISESLNEQRQEVLQWKQEQQAINHHAAEERQQLSIKLDQVINLFGQLNKRIDTLARAEDIKQVREDAASQIKKVRSDVTALTEREDPLTVKLPFALESIDAWGEENYALLSIGDELIPSRVGDISHGWKVLSIERSRGRVLFQHENTQVIAERRTGS